MTLTHRVGYEVGVVSNLLRIPLLTSLQDVWYLPCAVSDCVIDKIRLMSDYEVTLVNDNSKSYPRRQSLYEHNWLQTVYVTFPYLAADHLCNAGKNSSYDLRDQKRVCYWRLSTNGWLLTTNSTIPRWHLESACRTPRSISL